MIPLLSFPINLTIKFSISLIKSFRIVTKNSPPLVEAILTDLMQERSNVAVDLSKYIPIDGY